MADKKITIKPSDLERLRQLMREEEEKLDAADPSEAELEAMERELEDSIRRMARKTPGSLPSVQAEMDRNWSALQQKLKVAPATRPAEVVPLQPRRSNKALPWLGAVAAAALVFIMVRPGTRENGPETAQPGQIVMKNSGDSNPSAANCSVDVVALNTDHIVLNPNGKGYLGPDGTPFSVSVSCDVQPAFARVELVDSGAPSVIHALPMKASFLAQNKPVAIVAGKEWVLNVVVTDQEYPEGSTVAPEHVLWRDSITVGADK